MESYAFFESMKLGLENFSEDYLTVITWSLILSGVISIALLILQGVGMYTMAKRRNMPKKWLAFVPFANIYYLGKLAGECAFFGHKMKNAGLYAMIAEICSTLFTYAYIFAECYLYMTHGAPQYTTEGMEIPHWAGLTGFDATLFDFYEFANFVYPIISLVAEILLLVLVMGVYKKYSPNNYMMLSMLTLFFPLARYITVFAIRKAEPVDYDAYMRAKRDAYIRRQQQYGNPYNRYGNPYNPYGNPYGQGGYAGQNGGQYQQPKQEDPFEEFASKGGKTESETDANSDGFFD